jgi:hypothetical protein
MNKTEMLVSSVCLSWRGKCAAIVCVGHLLVGCSSSAFGPRPLVSGGIHAQAVPRKPVRRAAPSFCATIDLIAGFSALFSDQSRPKRNGGGNSADRTRFGGEPRKRSNWRRAMRPVPPFPMAAGATAPRPCIPRDSLSLFLPLSLSTLSLSLSASDVCMKVMTVRLSSFF